MDVGELSGRRLYTGPIG